MSDDVSRGREAISYFHNASCGFSGYNFTLDGVIQVLSKNPLIALDGIGLAIRSTGMSTSAVQEAMETLAEKAQGRVPNLNSFFSALSNRATQISYIDLTVDVGAHVLEKTGEGLQEIGESVLSTGKMLLWALPFIAAYIVWANVKKVT